MNIYYKTRYKKSTIKDKWHLVLIRILKIIAKTKLRKFLSFIDCYEIDSLDKTRDFNKQFLENSTVDIQLRNIDFIDVVAIDNLEIVEKHVIKIIRKHKFFTLFGKGKRLPASKVSEIKSNLDKFKKSFKTASSGTLFELINEKPTQENDLYEYIIFNYFKTFENLFILKLSVKPSKKFFDFLQEIQSNETIPTDKPIISHFKDFLRTKRIISGFRVLGNQKEIAFTNLIYDLNYQLKEYFFLGFKGLFSSKKELNPYITYFNTKDKLNYTEFKKGFGIIGTNNSSDLYYDQKTGYYLSSFWNSRDYQRSLHVFAENDMFPVDHDSKKSLMKFCLSNTLFRSWSILNYMQKSHSDLSLFSKTIFNFINSNRRPNFRKQIRIKTELSNHKIKTKRIQKEFSTRNIHRYLTSSDYDSRHLRAINFGWSKELNYYDLAKSNIEYFIKDNDLQITDLDEYFNEISSINTIKLNYRFQLIAVGLTILGLILTLASAKDIIIFIKNLIE